MAQDRYNIYTGFIKKLFLIFFVCYLLYTVFSPLLQYFNHFHILAEQEIVLNSGIFPEQPAVKIIINNFLIPRLIIPHQAVQLSLNLLPIFTVLYITFLPVLPRFFHTEAQFNRMINFAQHSTDKC